MKPFAITLAIALVSPVAHAGPTIVIRRLDYDFIRTGEKGRGIWFDAWNKANELLKKLEAMVKGGLEEHERQCFLQEALRDIIPTLKDGLNFMGKPQGDVTPELQRLVLERLDQANRCSPENRGYKAYHAWKAHNFQEPRQLPEKRMSLAEFTARIGVLVQAVESGAASPATPVIIVDPTHLPDVRPSGLRKTDPRDML